MSLKKTELLIVESIKKEKAKGLTYYKDTNARIDKYVSIARKQGRSIFISALEAERIYR